MGKISNRLKKLFQEQLSNNIINIADLRVGKELATDNLKSINSVDDLIGKGIDASDAVYLNMQNLTSVLMEGLIELPPASSMHRFFSKQEDLYEPGFPPHSPITNSYYNLWLQFDACFGDDKETIGSCILDMVEILQIKDIQFTALKNLCQSRMGIYEIVTINSDRTSSVREFVTHQIFDVKFDINFSGQVGDVVYIRILPNLFNDSLYTAFGVPYHLLGYSENEWSDYFKRHGVDSELIGFENKLFEHMKYGKDRNYWVEFTFWAYLQHLPDVIYLTGLPDREASQSAHMKFNSHLKRSMALRKIESRF